MSHFIFIFQDFDIQEIYDNIRYFGCEFGGFKASMKYVNSSGVKG